MPLHATPLHSMTPHVMPWIAGAWYAMVWHANPFHAMAFYCMSCHGMPFCAISWNAYWYIWVLVKCALSTGPQDEDFGEGERKGENEGDGESECESIILPLLLIPSWALGIAYRLLSEYLYKVSRSIRVDDVSVSSAGLALACPASCLSHHLVTMLHTLRTFHTGPASCFSAGTAAQASKLLFPLRRQHATSNMQEAIFYIFLDINIIGISI